jgi:PEP-CTERM motif-containing protein
MYVETTGAYSGQTLTFNGNVLSNTLVSPYTSVAFIKDFAPDYSSNVTMTAPVTPGPFSVSLVTIPDPARHVQYGFETIGPDAWSTDVDSKGSVVIGSVPEPATLSLAGMAVLSLVAIRRRCRR